MVPKRFSWVPWLASLVLIGNFAVLMMYGNTLRSTHLFIVRSTVFFPLAWLNLVIGSLLLGLLVWRRVRKKEDDRQG